MYIIGEMAYGDEELLEVTALRPLEGYNLWLRFSDGVTKICDFSSQLTGKVFRPLKDKKVFDAVELIDGCPTWCNGEVDVAPEFFYETGVTVKAESEIAMPELAAV